MVEEREREGEGEGEGERHDAVSVFASDEWTAVGGVGEASWCGEVRFRVLLL